MQNPFEIIETKLSNIETILLELKYNSNNNSQIDNDQWFDLKELCEYLPDKPTKATVYSWIHKRTIPFHRGSKKLRFLKSEIDEYLRLGKKYFNSNLELDGTDYLKKKGGKKC